MYLPIFFFIMAMDPRDKKGIVGLFSDRAEIVEEQKYLF